jgi:hypothetical protein
MRVPFTQSTRSKRSRSPGWKLYGITNQIPIEAVMVVTDAKGRKHNYKLHLTQANK